MQAILPQLNLARCDWRRLASLALPIVAFGIFVVGVVWRNSGLIGGGAIALFAIWNSSGSAAIQSLRRFAPLKNRHVGRHVGQPAGRRENDVDINGPPSESQPTIESPADHIAKRVLTEGSSTTQLVQEMIAQGRFALLLRPETVSELARSEIEQVLEVMDEAVSVVPEGRVLVGEYADRATWGATPTSADSPGLEWVDGCYLDRFAVTNSQFQHFVDAGAYEQFHLWPDEALPALFEFVDQTWVPAPAFWSDGRFPDGEGDYPAVGISWYEAFAYARWVGRRLPTDAEWTKAGAWPVETSPGRVTQRRYPWGDNFEARRAALWSAGQNAPLPVDAYEDGASLGGVCQLIGNVWEWTGSSFDAPAREGESSGHGLKVIHGGAFNTYFENQATCHFRSGERPLSRRANIGLRLALSFDVVADPQEAPEVEVPVVEVPVDETPVDETPVAQVSALTS